MSDGLQLLIEDYLGLMKESGELDVYLPLLITAMGHRVIHSAQKGVREHGVDIASVGRDTDRQEKLFLWVVKCGNIGRSEWNSGPQSIRHSLEDVVDSYLLNNVALEHQKMPKKIVVATNGEYLSAITQTMVGYMKSAQERHDVEVARVNGADLAAWTAEHLLDEHIMPVERRQVFRRMLANISQPELCQAVGRNLIDGLLSSAVGPESASDGAKRKRKLQALRGIRAALSVLRVRSAAEENLLSAYRLSEYALLAVWAAMHRELLNGGTEASHEVALLLFDAVYTAASYHAHLDPYYRTQDAFAYALPDNLFVSRQVFDEIGRLGLQGCFWAWQDTVGTRKIHMYSVYANRLLALLQSHSCSQLPAFDDQATAVHHGLLLLAVTGELDHARTWVHNMCMRLSVAQRRRDLWPFSCSLEDALHIRHRLEELGDEASSVSILLPILLTWAAVLGMNEAYAFLRSGLLPGSSWTTPNFWNSDQGYDDVVASRQRLFEHGVGESIEEPPEDMQKFLADMALPLPGVESIDHSSWFKAGFAFIPMMAALHWGLQLPREMLVRQAVAFATRPA